MSKYREPKTRKHFMHLVWWRVRRMQVDWLWGQWMFGFYVDRGQVHICFGPLSLHRSRVKLKEPKS